MEATRLPGNLEEIENHLRNELSGRVYGFRLAMERHGLVLHGHAHSYYAKQLAQQAVLRSTPLPITANVIEVI